MLIPGNRPQQPEPVAERSACRSLAATLMPPMALLAGLFMTVPAHAGSNLLAPDPLVCLGDGEFEPPPTAPTPVGVGQIGGFDIYAGATPPDVDPDRPVLVFVQGLHSEASSWWADTVYYGDNDMYNAAYARGYRTFFLESFGSQGTALTSFQHGFLLDVQLRTLTGLLGVDKVNIVAHSKGGLDSNVAATVMGAPVDTLVTLGSPHYGSPLADLAQVDFLEFLADILGFNDEGTKFLQTGCMALIRGFLDSQPSNQNYSLYTAAGTGWGPLLSSLNLAGLYLATTCPSGSGNDGLVCVEHARHPLSRDENGATSGEHRIVWDPDGDYEVDHDNIRMGNAPIERLLAEDCHVPSTLR